MYKVMMLDYGDGLKIKKFSDLEGIPMKQYVKTLLPRDDEIDNEYGKYEYMTELNNNRIKVYITKDNGGGIDDVNNQVRYMNVNQLIEKDRNKKKNKVCRVPKKLKKRNKVNDEKVLCRTFLLEDDNHKGIQDLKQNKFYISHYINYIISNDREEKQNGN